MTMLKPAGTDTQLTLFNKVGSKPDGPVRVHVAVEDPTLLRTIVTALSGNPELSVAPGAYGYSAETDVRVIDDFQASNGSTEENDGQNVPSVLVGRVNCEDLLLDAFCRGVWAYVPAAHTFTELSPTLIRVAEGECLLLNDIASRRTSVEKLMAKIHGNGDILAPDADDQERPSNPFTEREKQIIDGIAKGLSSPVIADRLGLSLQTVKNYVTGILTKTDTRKRAHAVAVAASKGWLDDCNGL